MAAQCTECDWTGSSTAVVNGGRCPECDSQVAYDGRQLISRPALDANEFNRRAARALRGVVDVDRNPFLKDVLPLVAAGAALTPAQQNGIYKTVLRHEDSITDTAVMDFATMHAKGA